jgi:CRISPR type III-associated protein (TIGR04423 family)
MKSIDNIPAGRYQGYIWMSDKPQPDVIDGPFDGMDLTPANPFIIEAKLFEPDKGLSYSVQFIDGSYVAKEWDVNALPEGELQSFLPAFDGAPGNLLFFTAWREVKDPLCENMGVLEPCENVFVGFKK